MDVTQVKMTLLDSAGAMKAIGSICFNDELAVRGIRVMERKDDGRSFIAFPQRERADGQYDDIAFPLTKELYHKVSDAVIKEYNALRQAAGQDISKTDFLKIPDNPTDLPFDQEPAISPAKAEAAKAEAPKAKKGRGR